MKKMRVGVVGLGCRGIGHVRTILGFKDVVITAVCDLYADRCVNAAKIVTENFHLAEPFQTLNYHELIARDDVDIVVVTTSWEAHIEIAIAALRAKKTCAMEVGGAQSVEECWNLVKAYEETKTPFMFLENCCYNKEELMTTNMHRAGIFGEIVHCHGAYSHDLRDEISGGKENRHYRLNHYLNRNCDNYPTHELGPIAKLLDINRGNRMVRLVSVASKAAGLTQYVNDRKDTIINKGLIGAKFNQGDIINTLIVCENGATISLKLDTTLPRSYSREFTVRGTKGLYEQNTNTVHLDGEPELWNPVEYYTNGALNNATKYEEEYLPDIWKSITQEQIDKGHGGMDYFIFEAFFDAVRNNKPMPIDVYDAASWMCVTALSEESIAKGNIPLEIPDFTKGAWKDRERFDVI